MTDREEKALKAAWERFEKSDMAPLIMLNERLRDIYDQEKRRKINEALKKLNAKHN